MRPLIICTLFCCFNSLTVSAQRYDFHVGLRLGCGISSNSNVQHILVSEEYYSNYSFRKRLQVVPAAELYFLYKPQGNLWGIEAGITYYNRTACVRYDDKNELNYTLSARYHHLGIAS